MSEEYWADPCGVMFFIPAHLVEALELYVREGELPGDFLLAVLRNDLVDACARADHINIRNIPAFASWLYNVAPSDCWGSGERVAAWVNRKKRERAAAPQPPDKEPSNG